MSGDPGFDSREMKENIAAVDWRLTPEDRAEIDRIFEEEGVPTYIDEPQALHAP